MLCASDRSGYTRGFPPVIRTTVYWKRLVIRSGLIFIGLVALLISLIPTGLRIGLAELAKRQGADEALIDNIDLNPLSGRFRIEGVYLRFKGAPPFKLAQLETDLSMRGLFDQRILVEKLLLDGLQADIREPAASLPRAGAGTAPDIAVAETAETAFLAAPTGGQPRFCHRVATTGTWSCSSIFNCRRPTRINCRARLLTRSGCRTSSWSERL